MIGKPLLFAFVAGARQKMLRLWPPCDKIHSNSR